VRVAAQTADAMDRFAKRFLCDTSDGAPAAVKTKGGLLLIDACAFDRCLDAEDVLCLGSRDTHDDPIDGIVARRVASLQSSQTRRNLRTLIDLLDATRSAQNRRPDMRADATAFIEDRCVKHSEWIPIERLARAYAASYRQSKARVDDWIAFGREFAIALAEHVDFAAEAAALEQRVLVRGLVPTDAHQGGCIEDSLPMRPPPPPPPRAYPAVEGPTTRDERRAPHGAEHANRAEEGTNRAAPRDRATKKRKRSDTPGEPHDGTRESRRREEDDDKGTGARVRSTPDGRAIAAVDLLHEALRAAGVAGRSPNALRTMCRRAVGVVCDRAWNLGRHRLGKGSATRVVIRESAAGFLEDALGVMAEGSKPVAETVRAYLRSGAHRLLLDRPGCLHRDDDDDADDCSEPDRATVADGQGGGTRLICDQSNGDTGDGGDGRRGCLDTGTGSPLPEYDISDTVTLVRPLDGNATHAVKRTRFDADCAHLDDTDDEGDGDEHAMNCAASPPEACPMTSEPGTHGPSAGYEEEEDDRGDACQEGTCAASTAPARGERKDGNDDDKHTNKTAIVEPVEEPIGRPVKHEKHDDEPELYDGVHGVTGHGVSGDECAEADVRTHEQRFNRALIERIMAGAQRGLPLCAWHRSRDSWRLVLAAEPGKDERRPWRILNERRAVAVGSMSGGDRASAPLEWRSRERIVATLERMANSPHTVLSLDAGMEPPAPDDPRIVGFGNTWIMRACYVWLTESESDRWMGEYLAGRIRHLAEEGCAAGTPYLDECRALLGSIRSRIGSVTSPSP
jgi:hypothetical protein